MAHSDCMQQQAVPSPGAGLAGQRPAERSPGGRIVARHLPSVVSMPVAVTGRLNNRRSCRLVEKQSQYARGNNFSSSQRYAIAGTIYAKPLQRHFREPIGSPLDQDMLRRGSRRLGEDVKCPNAAMCAGFTGPAFRAALLLRYGCRGVEEEWIADLAGGPWDADLTVQFLREAQA
ncbi:uncharacterized protein B0T23DRAFT_437244 [Neurospora hispaniola]|uniref:Uncharacterized protein n=1 Tax=Neurospora hispaniola TaxID=588809 RepID=A0AAJ0HY73_9PEZI|nr:hypothetical protein B0T23DRAFT_437244 [Neurospora hispaniola]